MRISDWSSDVCSSDLDLELRPLGLEIVLHHGEHARRTAGRGGDVEAIGGEPADHAVVADEAVFAQKQAVAATAGRQLGPGIGVHPVHEFCRIRPDDLDLAERGGVEYAERLPGCPA